MCGAKGMVFYPFWSEIWYQFWPFWSEKRVWFVHFSLNLELGMFFRRSYFFIIRRACYALIDLRVKSEIGYGKSEILVWNRERVSGSVSHTPTQFSWRHPPPLAGCINWLRRPPCWFLNHFSKVSNMKNCTDLNLGEDLCIFTSFLMPDFGLSLLNGFYFWKPAAMLRYSTGGSSSNYDHRHRCLTFMYGRKNNCVCSLAANKSPTVFIFVRALEARN